MICMNELYDNLQTTILKLVRLSDSRLGKLEQCLQMREFEEECAKVDNSVLLKQFLAL